mmetsp:Transcript_8344/g.31195  ORF Transcript_8344/g.31195 Transcript_8344/m.31195 type:complete len:213 (+) Transcript_8344:1422-2060(+)
MRLFTPWYASAATRSDSFATAPPVSSPCAMFSPTRNSSDLGEKPCSTRSATPRLVLVFSSSLHVALTAATDAATLNGRPVGDCCDGRLPRPYSKSTASRYPKIDRSGSTSGCVDVLATAGNPVLPPAPVVPLLSSRRADSNDASAAASATTLASAAASTALRNIADGITRGEGCGAFPTSRGALWGVTHVSEEEGDHGSGDALERCSGETRN